MGHWCKFCETWHSSSSCYHPANKSKGFYSSCSECDSKNQEIERLKERERALEELCKIYFEIAETKIPEEEIRSMRDEKIALLKRSRKNDERIV